MISPLLKTALLVVDLRTHSVQMLLGGTYVIEMVSQAKAFLLTYSTLRSTCPFSHPARTLQKRYSKQ